MSAFPALVLSGEGQSDFILINPIQGYSAAPYGPTPSWSCSLIATVSDGASLTYSAQVTNDQQPSPDGNWNNHDEMVNQTASMNSNIAFPVQAVRLVVTEYTSGTVSLGICMWP